MTAILKRELKSCFTSMITYIFIAFMLVVVGFFSSYYNFNYGLSSFSAVFYSCYFIALILIPFLTMRIFALERQEKTLELLYSLPVKAWGIVVSKYLSALAVLAVPMLMLCVYPLILSFFGEVNFLLDYTSLFAFFLLGASLIAVGMFVSSLCETQGVAAIVGFAALLFIYLMPDISGMMPTLPLASVLAFTVVSLLVALLVYKLTLSFNTAAITAIVINCIVWIFYFIDPDAFSGLFSTVIDKIALFTALSPFLQGVFDIGSVVLYLSVSFVFVFLTVISLEKKRYS